MFDCDLELWIERGGAALVFQFENPPIGVNAIHFQPLDTWTVPITSTGAFVNARGKHFFERKRGWD